MYWWDLAADLMRTDSLQGFGFITTNSLRQVFNRQVIERHLTAIPPLSIAFAIPDHPWVDSTDGADVRIAMTVCSKFADMGKLESVICETPSPDGSNRIEIITCVGEDQLQPKHRREGRAIEVAGG